MQTTRLSTVEAMRQWHELHHGVEKICTAAACRSATALHEWHHSYFLCSWLLPLPLPRRICTACVDSQLRWGTLYCKMWVTFASLRQQSTAHTLQKWTNPACIESGEFCQYWQTIQHIPQFREFRVWNFLSLIWHHDSNWKKCGASCHLSDTMIATEKKCGSSCLFSDTMLAIGKKRRSGV